MNVPREVWELIAADRGWLPQQRQAAQTLENLFDIHLAHRREGSWAKPLTGIPVRIFQLKGPSIAAWSLDPRLQGLAQRIRPQRRVLIPGHPVDVYTAASVIVYDDTARAHGPRPAIFSALDHFHDAVASASPDPGAAVLDINVINAAVELRRAAIELLQPFIPQLGEPSAHGRCTEPELEAIARDDTAPLEARADAADWLDVRYDDRRRAQLRSIDPTLPDIGDVVA